MDTFDSDLLVRTLFASDDEGFIYSLLLFSTANLGTFSVNPKPKYIQEEIF